MFFLNLSAGEFLALLGSLGGIVTALYLLDRAKRKRVVSTLRFWTSALAADDQQRRKRMNQPWSLLLQLLSLTCLLLAIAQLNWGTRETRGRDHVLLVDTSAWSGEELAGGALLGRERQAAQSYLSSVRPSDRILVVGVDALSTPVTAFTSNRAQLLSGLTSLKSGFSALDIGQALSFAKQAQSWSGGDQGEIVYIGPERVDAGRPLSSLPANLRVIPTPANGENAGIRAIAVRRSEEEAGSWKASITLRNDGNAPRNLQLQTQFAGTKFATRTYSLKPRTELKAEYEFVTNTAGLLTAEITPHDGLPADDRATLQLPANRALKVIAYTRRKELLKPLLESDHRWRVEYLEPARYQTRPAADLVILDSFSPAAAPVTPSLWISPPKQNSPLVVKSVVADAAITGWRSGLLAAAGLHAREDRIPSAEVFETRQTDVAFANLAAGPTIVLRPRSNSSEKLAVIGFDPLAEQLRFTLTTPLVFANLLGWLSPEAFRTLDISADRVGAASVILDADEDPKTVQVADVKGFAVPFTLRERNLQVFVSQPDIIRIVSENRERVLSLTLPDVVRDQWKPEKVTTGLPYRWNFISTATDLWKLLACLGGLGLAAEWFLFGGGRVRKASKQVYSGSRKTSTVQVKEELVSQ